MRASDQFDLPITNLTSMMAWFGLQRVALDPELLGSAIRVCLDCPSGEACRDWLAHAPTSPQSPTFCPNAKTFESKRLPYVRPWATAQLHCKGSLRDLGWEGRIDDPSRPKRTRCPVCGTDMKPDFYQYEFYEFEDKEGISWASVPSHYPGKEPEHD